MAKVMRVNTLSASTPETPAPVRSLGGWWRESWAQMRKHPFVTALVAIGIALGLGYGVYHWGYQSYVARQHWQRAHEALASDDFEVAVASLKECLATRPGDAATLFTLARTTRRQGDFAAAEAYLEQARKAHHPEAETAFEQLLLSTLARGPSKEEERLFRSLLDAGTPEAPLILEALAIGCFRANRPTEASAWLDFWVKHYTDDWRARFWRADFQMSTSLVARARPDLERVVELQPAYLEGKRALAAVLLQTGADYPRAAEYFASYLTRYPNDAESLNGLARCQRAIGNGPEAQATLDRLLGSQPTHPGGLLTKALLESDQDRPAQALALLDRLQSVPLEEVGDLVLLGGLAANCHRRLGNDKEAAAWEEKQARLNADLTAVHLAMQRLSATSNPRDERCEIGERFLRMGLETEGLRWLMSVLAEEPNHPRATKLLEGRRAVKSK